MRESNLHAVWDTGLIKSLNEDADTMARRLATKPVKFSPDWSAARLCENPLNLARSLLVTFQAFWRIEYVQIHRGAR